MENKDGEKIETVVSPKPKGYCREKVKKTGMGGERLEILGSHCNRGACPPATGRGETYISVRYKKEQNTEAYAQRERMNI